MYVAEVALDRLLPIDHEVKWQGVNQYLEKIHNGEELDPIRTLPYPEDDSEQHIILDGHHRARASQIAGRLTVPSIVSIDPVETAAWLEEERPNWEIFYDVATKDRVRLFYKKYLSKLMQRHNITTIDTIPEVKRYDSVVKSYETVSVIVNRDGTPVESTQ